MNKVKKDYIPNPYVIEQTSSGERSYDIASRLLEDRIVLIPNEVTDDSMMIAVAQLLYLNNKDESSPIHLYIMSPGGSCTAGLALIDVMNYIKAPVYTYAIGMAASMGAAILSCGEKGHRYAFPNTTVMTHQAIGGYQGSIQDAEVDMDYFKELNERLAGIIATNCGMTLKQYKKTVERNNYMFAEEAKKYGIVDEVLTTQPTIGGDEE